MGKASAEIEVATVDGFQGREKNIIVLSCVRASQAESVGGNGIGFLSEWPRLNTAITRAKHALWLVGHSNTLILGDEAWRQYIQFLKERACYHLVHRSRDGSIDDFLVETLPTVGFKRSSTTGNYGNRKRTSHR